MTQSYAEPLWEEESPIGSHRLVIEQATPNRHRLRLLTRDGTILIADEIQAGITSAGFSHDGVLAWCLTYGWSEEEVDAHLVIVYSVNPPRLLFKTESPDRSESIDLVPGAIEVTDHWKVRHRFSMTGHLMNSGDAREQKLQHYLTNGPAWRLEEVLASKISVKSIATWSDDECSEGLRIVDRILHERTDPTPVARCERVRGEIHLRRGDVRKALAHLTRAQSLNPRVGVKKLISQLTRELTSE